MSAQSPFAPGGGDPSQGRQPTEEEMRAAYEQELKRIRVEDVLVQTVVSLLNLGGRKLGLAPGTDDERDLEQARQAVEGVRALLPLVEPALGEDATQVQQALSQLQMAYAQAAGKPQGPDTGQAVPAPEGSEPHGEQDPEQAGPAQSSGRLWIPGQ